MSVLAGKNPLRRLLPFFTKMLFWYPMFILHVPRDVHILSARSWMPRARADHAGPCESCPPPTGGNDASASLLSCEESGYRKPVTCVLGKSEDAPLHEVLALWGCANMLLLSTKTPQDR